MDTKNKELLLKDLCARLPYGVKIELTWWVMGDGTCINTTLEPDHIEQLLNDEDGDTEIKPYLRPMSSMTEEEKEEYCQLQQKVVNEDVTKHINYCYKKHFDVNNLIHMGLAIDATNLNVY